MKVNAGNNKNSDPVPAGVHHAVCYAVIDLGTQDPGNPQFRASRKVMILWELPHETIDTQDGPKPRIISSEYTASIGKKATLRSVLESWRGKPFTADELKGFDVAKLIGVPCMLSVIHSANAKGKVFAKIASISGMPKGIACPVQYHKTVTYEVEQGRNDTFNLLPKWVKDKIEKCREWTGYPESPTPSPEVKNLVPAAALDKAADEAASGMKDNTDIPF